MRFYEFASDNDVQNLLPILKIMAAQSADRDSSGKISFDALKKIMADAGITAGKDPSEVLAALKAAIPGIEDLIEPVDSDGTTELDKPDDSNKTQPKPLGPGIEQMAKSNSKI